MTSVAERYVVMTADVLGGAPTTTYPGGPAERGKSLTGFAPPRPKTPESGSWPQAPPSPTCGDTSRPAVVDDLVAHHSASRARAQRHRIRALTVADSFASCTGVLDLRLDIRGTRALAQAFKRSFPGP